MFWGRLQGALVACWYAVLVAMACGLFALAAGILFVAFEQVGLPAVGAAVCSVMLTVSFVLWLAIVLHRTDERGEGLCYRILAGGLAAFSVAWLAYKACHWAAEKL